jgi:hypothetical protein
MAMFHNTYTGAGASQGIYIDLDDDPNSATEEFWRCIGNVTLRAAMRTNGGLANFQAHDVNLSDERLKADFDWEPESQWGFWKAIPIGKHRYADQKDGRMLWGTTAQRVQALDPDLVGQFDEDTLGTYEQQIEWRGRKVLQEAQERIEELEAHVVETRAAADRIAEAQERVETLEAEVEDLKARLAAVEKG